MLKKTQFWLWVVGEARGVYLKGAFIGCFTVIEWEKNDIMSFYCYSDISLTSLHVQGLNAAFKIETG